MSYYEMQSAKVKIAMELQKRGWKILGFKEDESDSMTDYWSPANWAGIATKNGYVVVIDCADYEVGRYSGKKIVSKYSNETEEMTERDRRVLSALKEMRQDRGASAAEEESAKERIAEIMKKVKTVKTEISEMYPVFSANPPHSNWHVELDGNIILKGRGISCFHELRYSKEEEAKEEMKAYSKDSYYYKKAEDLVKLWKRFNTLINRIDTAAGSAIGGSGKRFRYETKIVTKYKSKNVAVKKEVALSDGIYFICNEYLGNGRDSGNVYKVHKCGKSVLFTATKMNRALDKERNHTSSGNSFGYFKESDFAGYIRRGWISTCVIQTVQTPYIVTETVKVPTEPK